VEGNEVMLRIVWRHRWLLVIMVLAPIALVVPLRLAQPVDYTATADVQTQSAAPSASTQVSSILSQVSATATSPAVVQKAIDAAKVDRNANDVAKHQVSSASLNSSGIVAVTVKDPDRQVAAQLSRALAAAVVDALNAPGAAASQQLKALTLQESQLKATRQSLETQLSNDQKASLATTDPQVQAAITELAGVESQLAANQTAQQTILSNNNANEDASVLSEPTVATTTSASRGVVTYAALAGLLGLILGLLMATVDELVRPTVADPEGGARELGVVFLGDAQTPEGENAHKEPIVLDGDLVTRLHLAADRLGALTLVLTGPVPSPQLTELAGEMNRRLSAVDAWRSHPTPPRTNGRTIAPNNGRNGRKPGSPGGVKAPALAIGSALSTLKVQALSDLSLGSRPEAPTILVALRRFAPRESLDRVADLGETTGWPILGVVGVRHKPKKHRIWHRKKSTDAPSTSEDREPLPTNEVQSAKVTAPPPQAQGREVFVSRQDDRQGHAQ
jgi:capsular polysaccharide biosynthesis protein